ncbi:MAG: HdaA/DnaA family protein [Pseudomonadota bacterium]|jgi:DnaA family protein
MEQDTQVAGRTPGRSPVESPAHPQGLLDLEVPRPQDFPAFVVGDNEELIARLRAPAAAGGESRTLYIWGGTGCGCTHLLRAWSAQPGGLYVDLAADSAPAALERLVAEGSGRPVRVALDHVHRMADAGQQPLFNLYNVVRMEARAGELLVAGDRPPARLALRADLITRLSWGLVYEVRPLSESARRAAMARHAAARGMVAGEDLLDWLLVNVPRDLPTLLAMLDALDRWSLAAKRAPTVALAREWLRAASSPDTPESDR